MNIIGKTLLNEFIKENPSLRIVIVIWLKELPYYIGNTKQLNKPQFDRKWLSQPRENCTIEGYVHENSNDFMITKISLIDIENLVASEASSKVTVRMTPPPPTGKELKKTLYPKQKSPTTDGTNQLSTEDYYRLIKAIKPSFVDAEINPSFKDTINKIACYEVTNCDLLYASLTEMIINRMNLFQLSPAMIENYVGSDDIEAYLQGKSELPKQIIERLLYQVAYLKFSIDDTDFVK